MWCHGLSVVTGLAEHGFAKRALKMFQEMVDAGIKPNDIIDITILFARSYVGMIDEGWKHFYSMYKEHRISSRIWHHSCMVDFLGRPGFFEEAMQLIDSMSFIAHVLVWHTLLGAG